MKTTNLNQHYSQLLGLNEPWIVENVDLDMINKRVTINISWPTNCHPTCPICNLPAPLHDHRNERTWRHLDTMQFETVIKAKIPRSNCPVDGIKTINIPWAGSGSRFTTMFEHFAIDILLSTKSIKDAAIILGISWDQIQQIQHRAVERGLKDRELKDIKNIGIDEKSFLSGHKYASVMVDIDGARVLDVVKDRTQESANELWSTLPDEIKKDVDAVAMDMWPAFINAAKDNVPQADIVHDKFHIAKYLNEAVDSVRKKEHKELMKNNDEALKGKKYLFLKKPENMNGHEVKTFNELKLDALQTGRAWSIKEMFARFWNYSYEGSARKFFDQWYWWATHSKLKPIIKVARMIKNHFENIITYLRHRITNAMIEGFNSKIQSIKANARGFRNFKNYKIAILFYCGRLNLYPH